MTRVSYHTQIGLALACLMIGVFETARRITGNDIGVAIAVILATCVLSYIIFGTGLAKRIVHRG